WKCRSDDVWVCLVPVGGSFLERWGFGAVSGGNTLFEATFSDLRDMGAGRHVLCTQYKPEAAPGIPGLTYKSLCWASTHGPLPGTAGWGDAKISLDAALGGDPNRGWTFLEQNDKGWLFAAFDGLTGNSSNF